MEKELLFYDLYPLKILLAEDNEINRIVLQEFFTILGYQIDVASNGKEAVLCAKNKCYDIVLMDIHMPIMDGVEATSCIRQSISPEKCPIIAALTADDFCGTKKYLLENRMDDFFKKPFVLEDLKDILKCCYAKKVQRKNLISNQNFSNSPIVDAQVIDSINPKILQRIIDIFLDSAPKSIVRIGEYAKLKDTTNIVEEAHKLKGSCTALGLKVCAQICNEIQLKGEKKELSNISSIISTLEEHYYHAYEGLKNYQK